MPRADWRAVLGHILEAAGVEQNGGLRYFDLRPSILLAVLSKRLVIEWLPDGVNWAKQGATAAGFRVVEIADPEVVQFPGLDRVLISFEELLAVVEDPVSGVAYGFGCRSGHLLIADSRTGKLYVGKADGSERILAVTTYAKDGHGGNVALCDLAQLNASHCKHFLLSTLRVFGPQRARRRGGRSGSSLQAVAVDAPMGTQPQ